MVLPRALTADVASCAPLPCAAASSLGLCSVPSRTRGFCWLLPACCLRADEHLLEQSSKPLTFASQNELPIVSCTSSTQIKHSVKFGPVASPVAEELTQKKAIPVGSLGLQIHAAGVYQCQLCGPCLCSSLPQVHFHRLGAT